MRDQGSLQSELSKKVHISNSNLLFKNTQNGACKTNGACEAQNKNVDKDKEGLLEQNQNIGADGELSLQPNLALQNDPDTNGERDHLFRKGKTVHLV